MIEKELEMQPEIQEKKEYSFEEGVEETLKRIDSLLEKQDYIVVAISGSVDVGKTSFKKEVVKGLELKNITLAIRPNVADIDIHTKEQLEREKSNKGNKKCVVILEAANYPLDNMTEESTRMFKEFLDEELSSRSEEVGLPLLKVDLRIHIYRPDKPFSTNENVNQFADIVINNSHVKDDERKMRMK
ncbi:MAG: hypothetical protein PHN19_02580 [Patescibacteria group bacterium]|nr:hypothetical protein [Patescibacteria group bacterium]